MTAGRPEENTEREHRNADHRPPQQPPVDYPAIPQYSGRRNRNTLELLVTALILAFVFRAFVVEAFRIPTGSMAETLRGSHYHLRCIRCGFPYDVGGDWWSIPKPRCPSCGYDLPQGRGVSISNGDRILVLKCLYQFLPAKRWDVIVFKNPVEPRENYIKRLIGLPGETVEIIDGDVYIDGHIARKPPKVQEEVWMPIYNNDYQMLRGGSRPRAAMAKTLRRPGGSRSNEPIRHGTSTQGTHGSHRMLSPMRFTPGTTTALATVRPHMPTTAAATTSSRSAAIS